MTTEPDFTRVRDVIIGRNSTIWQRLSADKAFSDTFPIALSHRDLSAFRFLPTDRVWVFSYSSRSDENEKLLEAVKAGSPGEVIYVSTATANVASLTSCYRYPYVKLLAERRFREVLNARTLTIGLMFEDVSELPAGTTMATRYDDLAEFLKTPRWTQSSSRRELLFVPLRKPFSGAFERALYAVYGTVMAWCRRWPCVLRPVDLVLRALGYRWYGYLFLSNRLWSTTIS